MKIGICGSSGRNGENYNYDTFNKVYLWMEDQLLDGDELVSGGSSFVDNVAVRLFLKYDVSLHLALPCQFKNGKFTWDKLNNLHYDFQKKTGINSLSEMQDAIELGSKVTTHNGFFARNSIIAQSDKLLAAGFTKNPSGGTLNTWNKSKGHKVYMKL